MAEEQIIQATDNITYPGGFKANGMNCGIKFKNNDLGAIVSEQECTVAGMFTTNRVKSESLMYSMPIVKRGRAKALLVNSGNANTCIGRQGVKDARTAAKALARQLGVGGKEVLFFSTGIIGRPLPVGKIIECMPALTSGLSDNAMPMAQAIMTTDTKPKIVAEEADIGGKKVKLVGIAKGSGMISPKLATMLCFIATDANISQDGLKKTLAASVNTTFNRITIDGDTSTNDSVVVMANGMAGNSQIGSEGEMLAKFGNALQSVCARLARMLIEDAEGATKFITVTVKGSPDVKSAEGIAFAVADSKLVKTAMFGNNPNVGRIIAAVGYAKVKFRVKPNKVALRVNGIECFREGKLLYDEARAIDLKGRFIEIEIDLGSGNEEATIWTSDLSFDYVKINAEYN